MDDKDISRLIRSALPPDAFPDHELRQKTFECLIEEIRRKKASADFPFPVLGALAALFGGAALWVGWRLIGGRMGAGDELLVGGVVLEIAINLLFLPVAVLVVVLKNRRCTNV